MAAGEWVPLHEFGTRFTIAAGTQIDIPFLDVAEWGPATEVVGAFEESEAWRLDRVVGQFLCYWAQGPSGSYLLDWPITVALRAGMQDLGTQAVVTAGTMNLPEVQNEKFYWKREFGQLGFPTAALDAFSMLDPVNNPWWSTVDVRPREVQRDRDMPVYTVLNTANQDLLFKHFWRMYVTKFN